MYPSRTLQANKGPRPNITGFDVSKFAASAGQPRYDPWEKAEAWRYTGQFSRWQRFNRAFPGLGIATVAFAGYLVYDQLTAKDDHHGHGEEEHH